MNKKLVQGFAGAALALALTVAGCGGGGSGFPAMSGTAATMSTGAITAFGSVFVNGHEFDTSHARITDADTGASMDAAQLEVGMVVSVDASADSSEAAPKAADIRVSPLVRGYLDASDSTAGTLTLMGQTVQLTSATVFTDHRACLGDAMPCAEVSGQGGLDVTAGSTPGSFVSIHGYLFDAGSGGAQIVATLVRVGDAPVQGQPSATFKLEGRVTALDATQPSVTIGAETVDLHQAACRSGGNPAACASAFKVGDVVAAWGASAPTADTFAADVARLSRLLPQTAGATVEIEGKVYSVSGTSFVLRGITIDGSGLAADQIPAAGDKVEVVGTVADNGQSVVATKISSNEHEAASRVILAGPLASVTPGATAGTFDVSVLGQTATVSADTRIADRTVHGPRTFNITNFQTYLDGKNVFVVLRTMVDGTGALQASGFDIVRAPANGFVYVAGAADDMPTPGAGTTATVSVHGVPVLFDSTATRAMIAQGSIVLARGVLGDSGTVDTTVSRGMLVVLPSFDCGFDVGD